jgi:PAS domain S-box-containing protein
MPWEELVGKNIREVFPSAVGTEGYRTIERAAKEGVTIEFEEASSVVPGAWVAGRVYPSAEGSSVYFRDVTERKQAEEDRARLAAIVESSDDVIIGKTLEGIITSWNKGAERLYGYSAEEAVGQPISMLVPPERPNEIPRILESIRLGEKVDHFETVRVAKDGRRLDISLTVSPIRNSAGDIVGASTIARDITERKRTEEKLRESEERLQRAIRIETVGVIFFKTDGQITDANDAFLQMSGYSREDLVEGLVRWDVMTPPEWMPHSLKAIEEFESTGRTEPYEKEYIRKDGSRWWALFAATRLDEEEGVEFIIDITQSKRAEEELRKSGERITNILESITDAFVAVDRQWRFTYINERALTTLQRTREELLGKNMWEEFPEAVGLPAYREYHRAMTSGNSVHFEEFNPWLDIWVEINAYPSEGGLAIYFRDITERKSAEEERDRLRAREIEARTQKEERRRIARDLHDVVLQDLAGVLQSLRLTYLRSKGSELGLDFEEELEALGRATLGLRSAVHDLRGEKERPFVKSVESLVDLNRRLTPDCKIGLVVEEGFPNGFLGEVGVELLRVIREAFTNARYHSGAKSVVATLKVEGRDLVAEITDDGQGFELEAVPGVGLSSMQERAAMVDGNLEIESEVGKGTSVRLRVPAPQTG